MYTMLIHVYVTICCWILRLFHVDHLVQNRRSALLGTNGVHVKAKNERFTAASSRCRQNLKYEHFMSSFGSLRQKIAPKSVPHVQHDHFSSFNQWNHWFVALLLTLPSSNLKLPNEADLPRVKGISFWRNCGAASVGEWYTKIWFINGVDKCKLTTVQRLKSWRFER